MRHTLQNVVDVQEESFTLINVAGGCQFQHCWPEQWKTLDALNKLKLMQ